MGTGVQGASGHGGAVVVDPGILHAAEAVGAGQGVRGVARGVDAAELQAQLVHLGRVEARGEQAVEAPRRRCRRRRRRAARRQTQPETGGLVRGGGGVVAGRGRGGGWERGGLRLALEVGGLELVADAAVYVDARCRLWAARYRLALALALALAFALALGMVPSPSVGACRCSVSCSKRWRRRWWERAQDGAEHGGVGQDLAAVDEAQAAARVRLVEARADQVLERDDGRRAGARDVELEVGQGGAEADGEEERGRRRRQGFRGEGGLGGRRRHVAGLRVLVL